jgi:hypothetical protein
VPCSIRLFTWTDFYDNLNSDFIQDLSSMGPDLFVLICKYSSRKNPNSVEVGSEELHSWGGGGGGGQDSTISSRKLPWYYDFEETATVSENNFSNPLLRSKMCLLLDSQ